MGVFVFAVNTGVSRESGGVRAIAWACVVVHGRIGGLCCG